MSFFIPIINTILGVVGFGLLLIVIIVTPWQVKLILLTVGWIAAQRALESIQVANTTYSKDTDLPEQATHVPPTLTSRLGNNTQTTPVVHLAYRGGGFISAPTETIDEKT